MEIINIVRIIINKKKEREKTMLRNSTGGFIHNPDNEMPPLEIPQTSLTSSENMIFVDVSGAVNKPGVYQLKEGSRIENAVLAAEGFAQDANQEYISKYLNMAQKLSDGSKVYVPAIGEGGVVNQGTVVAGIQSEAKVNINTATQSELEALSGIGPVTASKIISDRPYGTIEDLLSKKVVSKAVFEKIKEQLVIY